MNDGKVQDSQPRLLFSHARGKFPVFSKGIPSGPGIKLFIQFSCFAACFNLIPAHNVFALYISHYLTFALHSVGQGPVSLYNNFICAKRFPQHFNGPSPVHTSWPSRTVTRGTACSGCKPVTGAVTAPSRSPSRRPRLPTLRPIRLSKTSVGNERLTHKTIFQKTLQPMRAISLPTPQRLQALW